MPQTPAVMRQEGDSVDYTPVAAVTAGDVIVIGTSLVTVATCDIAANTKGSVATRGVFNFPKDNSDFAAAGVPVYWDADGNPYGGTAGTGCLSDSSADGPLAGFALEAAGSTTGDVDILLRSVDSATVPGVLAAFPMRTLAAAGSVIGNAAAVAGTGVTRVTGADNTTGVQLPASPTGKLVVLQNSVADKTLKVYPQANAGINATGTNTAYVMPAGSVRHFYGYNATAWITEPATIA